MSKLLWTSVLAASLLVGCRNAPEPHAPPSQKVALLSDVGGPLTATVTMEDPGSSRNVVSGFADKSEGAWRWAYEHPKLQFWGPDLPKVNFMMDYSVPEQCFTHTGPFTLTISINGKMIDKIRIDKAGQQEYSHAVPAGLVKKGAANDVSIEPDKTYTPPNGNARYSFVLVRAGFVE